VGEKDLVPYQSTLNLFGDKFELHPNGIIVKGDPTSEEYDEAFRRLSMIESATAWWYGDLANAREKKYGSLRELAEKLEINYNSLHSYQYVATAYPTLDIRISSVSFVHHQVAAPLEDRLEWLQRAADEGWTTKQLKLEILASQIEPPSFDGSKPKIWQADYRLWLPKQPQCDLLLTDPPYSTDINEPIEQFASWLPLALDKIKPSGHAYIFIGSYPREIKAYLAILGDRIEASQLLVWEYKNTMGPAPTHEYKTNWQAIIYYHGTEATKLVCPILLEQYSVQQFNMPSSKDNPYHHTWEKPSDLAERFIRHSTKKGDLILDCFAGTGTFLVSAAKYGRSALGCDVDKNMIDLAIKRGCELE